MFNGSSTEDEDPHENLKENNSEKLKVTFEEDTLRCHGNEVQVNISDNHKLISRPNKCPPPPPPIRSSSITSNSSINCDSGNTSIKSSTTSTSSGIQATLSTFKPNAQISVNSVLSTSPTIPTPDYDLTPVLGSPNSLKKREKNNINSIEKAQSINLSTIGNPNESK